MRFMRSGFVLLFLSALLACNDNTPQTKSAETVKPAKREVQLLDGREAFQKMYVSARGWVSDARPYSLESAVTAEGNGQAGKAVIWRSGFASLSRRGLKAFLWSGSALPDATIGVSSGVEDTYNPSNSSTQTFEIGFLKVDSDKAYDVALKHGGDKLIKANANQPVMFTLDWSPRENVLTWHIIFGTGIQDARLRIAVNASTGEYIRTEK